MDGVRNNVRVVMMLFVRHDALDALNRIGAQFGFSSTSRAHLRVAAPREPYPLERLLS
jgi:hypothetical protein